MSYSRKVLFAIKYIQKQETTYEFRNNKNKIKDGCINMVNFVVSFSQM